MLHINKEAKTCTCPKHFDKGVCKHLGAAFLNLQIQLYGLVQSPKKFKIIRRQKRPQYHDESRIMCQEEAVVDNILKCEIFGILRFLRDIRSTF